MSATRREVILTNIVPVVFVAAILGVIYIRTLSPVIGPFGDMAKFAFLGKILGTPHTSGYPTYMVLNHIFVTTFPKGTLAWKANLLSAIFSAATACFLYGTLISLQVRKIIALLTAVGHWTDFQHVVLFFGG